MEQRAGEGIHVPTWTWFSNCGLRAAYITPRPFRANRVQLTGAFHTYKLCVYFCRQASLKTGTTNAWCRTYRLALHEPYMTLCECPSFVCSSRERRWCVLPVQIYLREEACGSRPTALANMTNMTNLTNMINGTKDDAGDVEQQTPFTLVWAFGMAAGEPIRTEPIRTQHALSNRALVHVHLSTDVPCAQP
jgi:hypothetical protein